MKRSAWLVWLAGLALMALALRLGVWQLDRAAQKVAVQQARAQRAAAPVLPASGLPGNRHEAQAAEHRRAVVTGRWLGEHTVYLENRPGLASAAASGTANAKRVGFVVMTPLALPDARVLLVQRGWWPRDAADRTRVAAPPPPAGEVQVQGRIALTAPRVFELAAETSGPIRQNLDLDAFARERGLPLLPWVLVQQDDSAWPPNDGLSRQWPEPAADVHKHHGYAAQWFGLVALLAALLLWFQVLRPWRRRQRT